MSTDPRDFYKQYCSIHRDGTVTTSKYMKMTMMLNQDWNDIRCLNTGTWRGVKIPNPRQHLIDEAREICTASDGRQVYRPEWCEKTGQFIFHPIPEHLQGMINESDFE